MTGGGNRRNIVEWKVRYPHSSCVPTCLLTFIVVWCLLFIVYQHQHISVLTTTNNSKGIEGQRDGTGMRIRIGIKDQPQRTREGRFNQPQQQQQKQHISSSNSSTTGSVLPPITVSTIDDGYNKYVNGNRNESGNNNDNSNNNDNNNINDNTTDAVIVTVTTRMVDTNKEERIIMPRIKIADQKGSAVVLDNNNKKKEEEAVASSTSYSNASTSRTTRITTTRQEDSIMQVYNPWNRQRYVCGIPIPPNATAFLNISSSLLSTTNKSIHCPIIANTLAMMSSNDHRNSSRSLFMSTRIFEYDPPLPPTLTPSRISQPRKTIQTNATTTTLNRTSLIAQIPIITIRFGQEVDYPIVTNSYHIFGINDKHLKFHRTCNVPCHYSGDFYPMTTKFVTYEGLPFRIKEISMEGSGYYNKLRVDSHAHFQNEFYATTSMGSDIPLTYYSLKSSSQSPNTTTNNNDNNLRTYVDIDSDSDSDSDTNNKSSSKYQNYPKKYSYPPVNYETGIKGASFLARNCGSLNKREQLVQQLIDATTTTTTTPLTNNSSSSSSSNNNTDLSFRIDSLSTCVHHTPYGYPQGLTSIINFTKEELLSQYLFHLAFENQNVNDYITEKLWKTFQAGTIPIYFGASNIKEHLPHPHSIIVVNDYLMDTTNDTTTTTTASTTANTVRGTVNITKLVNHLRTVANNRTLYYSYHQWRRRIVVDDDNDNDKTATGRTTTTINTPNINNNNYETQDNDTDKNRNDYYYHQFVQKYEFTKTHSHCRICRLGYAYQYGWSWNHATQSIQELHTLEQKQQDTPYEQYKQKQKQKQKQEHKTQLIKLLESESNNHDVEEGNHNLEPKNYTRQDKSTFEQKKQKKMHADDDSTTTTTTTSVTSSSSSLLSLSPNQLFSRSYNRSTCIDSDTNRMIYPFQETWSTTTTTTIRTRMNHNENNNNNNSRSSKNQSSKFRCDLPRNHHQYHPPPIIVVGDDDDESKINIERTVWDHDGITDMEIVLTATPTPTIDTVSIPNTTMSNTNANNSNNNNNNNAAAAIAANNSNTSVTLLQLRTPFHNVTEMIVVKRHTHYDVESKWRNEKWERYATASNKISKKRIIQYRNYDTAGANANDNKDEYLKGGTLIWIQNNVSRIVLMVNEPNVLLWNDNDDYNHSDDNSNGNNNNNNNDDHDNVHTRNTATANTNNIINQYNSPLFYQTVPLNVPGTIQLTISTPTTTTITTQRRRVRLRWIIEDIDTFHSNGKFKESYFSAIMVDEFFHPIVEIKE